MIGKVTPQQLKFPGCDGEHDGIIMIQSDRCQIKEFIYPINILLKNNGNPIRQESDYYSFRILYIWESFSKLTRTK